MRDRYASRERVLYVEASLPALGATSEPTRTQRWKSRIHSPPPMAPPRLNVRAGLRSRDGRGRCDACSGLAPRDVFEISERADCCGAAGLVDEAAGSHDFGPHRPGGKLC